MMAIAENSLDQHHYVVKRMRAKLFSTSIIVIAVILIGSFTFMKLEHLSFLDSMYFSVTTLTTVGYGDFYPTTAISKMFAIVYMLVGLSLTLYSLSVIAIYIYKREEPKIEREIKKTVQFIKKEEPIVKAELSETIRKFSSRKKR